MASNTTKKKTTAKSKTNSSSGKKTKPAAVSAKRVDTSNGKKVNSAGKKGKITEPVPEKEKTNPLILQEAALWLVLAVCILIFISYFGIGGFLLWCVRAYSVYFSGAPVCLCRISYLK